MHKQCESRFKKFGNIFKIYISVVKHSPNLTEVDYINKDNQLEDSALFIGFTIIILARNCLSSRERVTYHQLKKIIFLKE